jgi:hypothetical protein
MGSAFAAPVNATVDAVASNQGLRGVTASLPNPREFN